MHKSDKIKYIYYYLFLFSVNIHIMFMFCTIPHLASSSDLYVFVYASVPQLLLVYQILLQINISQTFSHTHNPTPLSPCLFVIFR